MMTITAPGKLFIAGEYAVVTPGEPAVLVAVDRYIRVDARDLEPGDTGVSGDRTGSIRSDQYGVQITWTLDAHGIPVFRSSQGEPIPATLVTETVNVVSELARSRGVEAHPLHLTLTSDLIDADGRKFGLGSSGAVTVALVNVLGRAWGLELTLRERFQLALLATLTLSPRASGGDIAASTITGWVRYASPNRDWVAWHRAEHGVAATLSTPWEGLELRRLPEVKGLTLTVGWTGFHADTDSLVQASAPEPTTKDAFLISSHSAVDQITEGCDAGNITTVLEGVAAARDALSRYDEETGRSIETNELAVLRTIAERHGAVAKPSGAGGGDCGIVLSDRHVKVSRILEEWRESGIMPLEVAVHTQEEPR